MSALPPADPAVSAVPEPQADPPVPAAAVPGADVQAIDPGGRVPPGGPDLQQRPEPAVTLPPELVADLLAPLLGQRAQLQQEIRELEQQRQRLSQELEGSVPGRSEAIARRLKGFQDYLVGALQDLAISAEQLELVRQPLQVQPSPLDQPQAAGISDAPPPVAGLFSGDAELIQARLQAFQGQPDFYADPWRLRRTLEPAGAALLEAWFLEQGGRGAQPSTGSRSRNALVTAAAIAILTELYGDRVQTLVLAGEPERLGDWRRGLQDCLGLSRNDFGPSSGIVLFERAESLIERADRLEERGEAPFIVVDAAERAVAIPVLQFPLWLAFAAGPAEHDQEDTFL